MKDLLKNKELIRLCREYLIECNELEDDCNNCAIIMAVDQTYRGGIIEFMLDTQLIEA